MEIQKILVKGVRLYTQFWNSKDKCNKLLAASLFNSTVNPIPLTPCIVSHCFNIYSEMYTETQDLQYQGIILFNYVRT